MTPTLRRLNDRERYYGLTWPGWVALAAAGAVLYGAVRISPLGLRATVTVVVLALAFLASVALALQGQTIGPGRYLLALYRYRRATKQLGPPARADRHGFVLDAAPDTDEGRVPEPGLDGAAV
jgi:predicted N-acetyltransferase YhbS